VAGLIGATDTDISPDGIVTLPYKPRNWAKGLHASLARWAVLVLHRRAGKTTGIVNHHQRAALSDEWEMKRLRYLLPHKSEAQLQPLLRHRIYWHVMPTYKQAKTVAWSMTKDYARSVRGVKFNESELKVTYPNENILQLIGGDDPDSLRGPGLSGLSLDEFSQIPREAFSEVLSKALADHLGYCIFSGTIKGTDQLYQTYEAAKGDPDWFSLWQNVDVSLATEEGPTLDAIRRAMEDDRKLIAQGLMLQEEYDQEWFLSPDAAIRGAWFTKEMGAATRENRITAVPYEPMLMVDTYWDLGIADSMSIWFVQTARSGQVRVIDYYESSGEGFPHYITMLAQRGYVYGRHWAPHDIKVRELGTGKSRLETARGLGLIFHEVPDLPFEDGIAAARLLMGKCWFDANKCATGLTSLRNYRKSFNQRLNEFTGTAIHDIHSHAADAFRYLAVAHKEPRERGQSSGRALPIPRQDGWAV
jgi:phage terminase large subunit